MAKRRTSAPGGASPRRRCGTMAVHMRLLEQSAGFRSRQARLEMETVRRRSAKAAPRPLVTVDVVVNVVYQTDAQNIKAAQIKSQIDVLNRDYAAANPDRSKVPQVWQGLVTDVRLRFKLARTTRTKTAHTSFSTDDSVKKASTGGKAPYKPESHLNLWVCELSDGVLGYAQFPGGPSATDGVVIDYRAFGSTGTAAAPFNLGRTATHEIGHYFNLRHIWGDTEDCSGTDFVADTPNAAGPNYGTPTFPTVTCNNGPNGDMFMNYMDYVDDQAMFLFTAQQVVRMRTALDSARPGLK
jgi:pregnancy-associated plasma protein-A